ncbi:MAG: glycosyltransferase [Bacteroidota bacterium]|nr:glycosyltransferase [Bacteroidota bacterium]
MNIILSVIFFLAFLYVCLILFYLFHWKKIPKFISESPTECYTKVSIVIPARNEEEHIQSCIEHCLKQNYPAQLLEIIVVDDQSEDNTPNILEEILDPRFKFMRLGVFKKTTIQGSKKKAISYGVNHASGDLIICTDADCLPGVDWVKSMVLYYQKHTPKIICGPVKIKTPHTFIEKFQALDFAISNLINAAGIKGKLHYLCNGANLAYEKLAFIESAAYDTNQHIASGDDIFLLNKIKKLYPQSIHYIKSEEAIVETQSVKTISEFIQQRLRWAGKVKHLSDVTLIALSSFIWVFRVVCILTLIVGFVVKIPILIYSSVICIFSRWILDFLIQYHACRNFKILPLLWWIPIMNIFYTVYYILIGFISWLPIRQEWKGRYI